MNATPRRTTLRRLAAAAVMTLAVSPLAACGGSSDTSATDPGTTGATTSTSPTTGTTTGTTSTPSSNPGGEIPAADFIAVYQKAIDQATSAKVALSVDGPTGKLTGSGVEDFSGGTTKAKLTLGSSGGTPATTVIVVDNASYVDTGNGKYLKVDLSKALGDGSTNLFDPSATLPLLQKAITKVTDLGPTTIDGGTYQGYEVTLDGKALGGSLGSSSGTAQLPSTLTEKIYVDDQGLLHQIVADTGSVGAATVTFTDWGTPVTIEAPDPSQVESLPGGN
jgi:hypothetical protein